MSLRLRLAAAFALVALLTALVVSLATPFVVSRGFALLEGEMPVSGGRGAGPMAGPHAQQIQQDTITTLVVAALGAAAVSSLLGVLLANRIARPLGRLETAASAVARGDLARRSGLADRTDELGTLGRSFDSMAASLQGAEASRRRFFGDVVHELKTPLAVIEATSTAVLDGVYQHADEHLETIRAQSRLLARIVDDLRTISLAEEGALPLRIEQVRVAEVLREELDAFRPRADRSGVSLVAPEDGPATVRADPVRLRQVLGALLDNALRHTPSGGTVHLEVTPGPGVTRVVVADTGPGIDPEDLPHLFDRFYQADAARDRTSGTSGLGLAIVRAIVDAHAGRVGAENASGGGARFWLELPSAD